MSSGRCWSSDTYNPCPGVMPTAPASNGYRPGFTVNLMAKDLGLAMEIAAATGANTPLGELAQRLYRDHQGAGAGPKDFSSILELLQATPNQRSAPR